MRTCLKCGGSAYSEYDPYCEHDFGDPPEPEFVKDLRAGYGYAEPYWLAASHPNDDGEWTYHAAHPTREGAIAAYEDGWRKGRFVHALFTRLTEWCREGEEAREGRERALPPRLIVRIDSYPEEGKRVRLSGDCEAPDLRGLQGTMIKWDGRPAVSLDRPVFAAGAPYSIVTLDSPLKVVEVVEEETPLQLSVPPTTADTECQPKQPTFGAGDRVLFEVEGDAGPVKVPGSVVSVLGFGVVIVADDCGWEYSVGLDELEHVDPPEPKQPGFEVGDRVRLKGRGGGVVLESAHQLGTAGMVDVTEVCVRWDREYAGTFISWHMPCDLECVE